MGIIDPRQIVAGVLTVTMFLMLGNMIKREHFDAPVSHHVNHAGSTQSVEDSEKSLAFDSAGDDPWKEEDTALKPCWSKPDLEEVEESKGFVTFSLTNGPEYHVSQVTDAVVVARYLRATLVIPDIRGSQPGDRGWCGDGAEVVRARETTVCEGEGDGRERWSREGEDEWSRWSWWCGDERETMSELGVIIFRILGFFFFNLSLPTLQVTCYILNK